MKKLILALFVLVSVVVFSLTMNLGFDKENNQKEVTNANVEALAQNWEIYCFYAGSVDCPRAGIKVYYVVM